MGTLESETEHKIIVYREAIGTKRSEAPAVGVRITVGHAGSILHREEHFNELWCQKKRHKDEITKYPKSDGYQ